jgi:hypothetical protein
MDILSANTAQVKGGVKNQDSLKRLDGFLRRANVTAASVQATAKHLLSTKGPGGMVTYADIEALGYSRRTAIWVAKRLVGLKIFRKLTDGRGGRGREAIFQICWGFSPKTVKTKTLISKDIKKQSKDGCRLSRRRPSTKSLQVRGRVDQPSPLKRTTKDYEGLEAERVRLVLGARFYRSVMQSTRLGLESWSISKNVRHALEGLIGNKIDGMSLADARDLILRVTLLRGEIERRARTGATPRRICSFVAGRLAGRQDFARSKRAVLKRTAELIKRVMTCAECGGSLRDGNVGGRCWTCYEKSKTRIVSGPAMAADLVEGVLKKIGLNAAGLASATAGLGLSAPGVAGNSEGEAARCRRCGILGSWAYSICDDCRRALVRGSLRDARGHEPARVGDLIGAIFKDLGAGPNSGDKIGASSGHERTLHV